MNLFSVYDMREGAGVDILGCDMHRQKCAVSGDDTLFVKIRDCDTESILEVKNLILKMTSYEPWERPKSDEVYKHVCNAYYRIQESDYNYFCCSLL